MPQLYVTRDDDGAVISQVQVTDHWKFHFHLSQHVVVFTFGGNNYLLAYLLIFVMFPSPTSTTTTGILHGS